MYQKCPVCNGTGLDQVSGWTGTEISCPTCKGKRIINEITGEPPGSGTDQMTMDDLCEKFKNQTS